MQRKKQYKNPVGELVACNRQREAAREQIKVKTKQITMKAKTNIFSDYPETWMRLKYDGRRKAYYLGLSKKDFEDAQEKHALRIAAKFRLEFSKKTRYQKIKSDLAYFSEIPYEYQGDGLDDFNKYQRPASNGIGWVAICPGERGNNYYVDEPVTVAILKKRYNKHLNTQKT